MCCANECIAQIVSQAVPKKIRVIRMYYILALITLFLQIHPFGVSTKFLWSYVQVIEPEMTLLEILELLHRFPDLFSEKDFKAGSNIISNPMQIERKWVFNGFKSKSAAENDK